MPGAEIDEDMQKQIKDLDKKTLQQIYDIVNVRIPQIDTEVANLEIEIKTAQEVLKQVESKMKNLCCCWFWIWKSTDCSRKNGNGRRTERIRRCK